MPSKHRTTWPEGSGTVARPFLTLSPRDAGPRKESCVTFAKKGMRTAAPGQLSQSTEASGNILRANSEDAQAISSSLQVLAGIQGPSGTEDPDTQASSQLETPSTDRRGADDGIKGGTVSKRGANREPGSLRGSRPMRYSKAPQTQP
ncbi:hypothetical protein MG293_020766 [Ovis ammon polii]|uniref:Uncharacterized protein n=1 Tax=Ovis ammon polii TaxID=230172 RepID=A0AAD4Y023_OVIAM|nr:hypothetical protein MG293_020766 [Ovis ammon polii]KAI4549961.1 hypothetical protein MJT46_019110 [Ovis ammon polii x Ovis aries]